MYPGASLAAHPLQPAHEAMIEILIAAHRVIDAGLVLQQSRQDVVEVRNGKSVIRTVLLAGRLEPGSTSMPGFGLGILLATEEQAFALGPVGHHHQYGFRFGKPCQVEEVAVGAKGVVDVAVAQALGSRGLDGDAAIIHDVHQPLATSGVFPFIHEWPRILSARCREPCRAPVRCDSPRAGEWRPCARTRRFRGRPARRLRPSFPPDRPD